MGGVGRLSLRRKRGPFVSRPKPRRPSSAAAIPSRPAAVRNRPAAAAPLGLRWDLRRCPRVLSLSRSARGGDVRQRRRVDLAAGRSDASADEAAKALAELLAKHLATK